MSTKTTENPPGQMRAFRANAGDKKGSIQTIDIPTLGPLDVLISIKSAGLAPGVFTLLETGRLSHLPATLGHEAAGVVAEIGADVETISIGQRVRVHTGVSCRSCTYCLSDRNQMCSESGIMGFSAMGRGPMPLFVRYRNGGLAEYIRAPFWLVDELPDNVSFDLGAKIPELATAYHTLGQAHLPPHSIVIITAPTGAIGTAMIRLAQFFGISRLVLVGRSQERLEAVARLCSIACDLVAYDQLGDDWPSTQALARKLNELLPTGADALMDLVPAGAEAWQALAGLAVNGTFVHLGGNSAILPMPMVAVMVKCWKIVGTRSHSRQDARKVLGWLADGTLRGEDLITHRWKFEEVEEAVARLRDRSLPIWMMVVNM